MNCHDEEFIKIRVRNSDFFSVQTSLYKTFLGMHKSIFDNGFRVFIRLSN